MLYFFSENSFNPWLLVLVISLSYIIQGLTSLHERNKLIEFRSKDEVDEAQSAWVQTSLSRSTTRSFNSVKGTMCRNNKAVDREQGQEPSNCYFYCFFCIFGPIYLLCNPCSLYARRREENEETSDISQVEEERPDTKCVDLVC